MFRVFVFYFLYSVTQSSFYRVKCSTNDKKLEMHRHIHNIDIYIYLVCFSFTPRVANAAFLAFLYQEHITPTNKVRVY